MGIFHISVLVFAVLIMQRLRRLQLHRQPCFSFYFEIFAFTHMLSLEVSKSGKNFVSKKFLFHVTCSAFLPLAVITLIRDLKRIYQTYFRILLHESLHLAVLT